MTLEAWGWKLSDDKEYIHNVQSSVFGAFHIFNDLLEYQLTLMEVPYMVLGMSDVLGDLTG